MQPLFGYDYHLSPQLLLTPSEQMTFKELGPDLQKAIEPCLAVYPHVEAANLLKTTLELCSFSHTEAESKRRKELLVCLLSSYSSQLPALLNTLILLYQRLGWPALYSSLRETMLTVEVLSEVICVFEQLLRVTDSSLEKLGSLPPYERGGKAYLERLVNQPNLLKREIAWIDPVLHAKVAFGKEKSSHKTLSLKFCDFNAAYSHFIQYLSSLDEPLRPKAQEYMSFLKTFKERYSYLGDSLKIVLLRLVIAATTSLNKLLERSYTKEDMQKLLEQLMQVYENCGEQTLECLLKLSDVNYLDILTLCEQIIKRADDFETLEWTLKACERVLKKRTSCHELIELLTNQASSSSFTELYDFERVLQRFRADPTISSPLSDEHLESLKMHYQTVLAYCKSWENLELSALVQKAEALRQSVAPDAILQLVAIGILTIRLKKGITLYSTQVLTALSLIDYPSSGCLAQVRTGEGKTYIIELIVFVLSHRGLVHVVLSADSLAMRDSESTANLLKDFGITVSNLCQESLAKSDYTAQVIYSTAVELEFTLMREMLQGKHLLASSSQSDELHRFDFIVIDESDNLTLDTAQHKARIAYSAKENYQWIYAPIFHFLKKQIAKQELYLLTTSLLIKKLRKELQSFADGRFTPQIEKLSDDQLQVWLQAAYRALYQLEEGVDYVIVNDASSHKSIQIVDHANTGELQEGMRWSFGTHEFVEIKHALVPKSETITPLSFSHASLYDLYRRKIGLTGTLGSTLERETIRDVYGLNSFDVPSHLPSKRVDLATSIVKTDQEQMELCLQTVKHCKEQGRPLLIICPTIKASLTLQKALFQAGMPSQLLDDEHEVYNAIQAKTGENVLKHAGKSGAVTIATNIAGRGTDIKVSKEVSQRGGLHVLLTFYPHSQRVEDQARGRAGRNGQKGSSQMILSVESLHETLQQNLQEASLAKMQASLAAKRQLDMACMHHEQKLYATLERECFRLTNSFYSNLALIKKTRKNKELMQKYTRFLADQRLSYSYSVNAEPLEAKEKELAQLILALFKTQDVQPIQWKGVIRQMAGVLQERLIRDFEARVYRHMQELILTTNASFASSSRQHMAKCFHIQQLMQGTDLSLIVKVVQKEIETVAEHEFHTAKTKMNTLYTTQQKRWEQFTKAQVPFFMVYIQELIGIELMEIG